MNTLRIKCIPSVETGDHQALLLVDGEDFLADDYIGLDPPRLLGQSALLAGGDALIGRCDCGCEGCSDYFAEVSIYKDKVLWRTTKGYAVEFEKQTYIDEIERAAKDHSWEDQNRTAERLVNSVFEGMTTKSGYKYDWASARIEAGKITLSLSREGTQKLMKFDWDGIDPTSARLQALREMHEVANA